MPQESTNLKLKLYNAITDAKESAIKWFNDIFDYSNSNWVKIDEAYGKINSSYIKNIEASGNKLIITKGDDAKAEIDGAIAKPATKTSLGTVQIGDNIFVDVDGIISLKKDSVDGALGYEAAEKMNLIPITIPNVGWTQDDNSAYPYYINFIADGIKPTDCVALVIAPDSNLVAQKCFFAATEALTDKIKIRVRNIPTETIQAFYYKIREDIMMSFGQTPIGGAILPPATKKELGGIIVGDGLNITDTGVLSATTINFDKIYPVGSIYQSTSSTEPAELFGGTWERIADERVLMGASTAHPVNTTVEAGLPNIEGGFNDVAFGNAKSVSGALATSTYTEGRATFGGSGSLWVFYYNQTGTFNASRSSSIYGNSATVQPATYYINIWKRIE